MKKKYLLLLIIPILILFTGCEFHFKVDTKITKLELFSPDDTVSITIDSKGKYDDVVEVTDKEDIKKILDQFKGKETVIMSVDDKPSIADDLLYITFKNKENKTISLYFYKKLDDYYIEIPQDHIYMADEEEYKVIESLLHKKEEPEYKFTLDNFNVNEIKSVKIDAMSQYGTAKSYTDYSTISKLHKVFSNKGSNTESTDYNPDNPKVLFYVTFESKSNETKSYYIYERDSKYFIEVSFKGIYDSNIDEFNIVKELS